jgi:RNA polymerase sigma factor (sigma-70 family)
MCPGNSIRASRRSALRRSIIARFLISKEFRRQGREPIHNAQSLEAVDQWASAEPSPPAHAISEEEKAILWRSIERVPEIYREALVLFYRQHESIEAVARDLELSEDAVKQRLSRGRKLLQDEFLAFVAGALKGTTPGQTFTLGVMAGLPLLATSAKAASARRQDSASAETIRMPDKSYNLWVTLGMLGPACLLGMFAFALFFSNHLSARYIPEVDARKIISERQDAQFTVCQYRDGSGALEISLPENHRIDLSTPLTDSLRAALAEKKITYPTLVEERDFHNGGVRGWLVLLSTLIVVAGTVLLVRRPGTRMFAQQEAAARRAGEAAKIIKKFFAVCASLVMLATSLLPLVSDTPNRWLSVPCSLLLVAGALGLLRWVMGKSKPVRA